MGSLLILSLFFALGVAVQSFFFAQKELFTKKTVGVFLVTAFFWLFTVLKFDDVTVGGGIFLLFLFFGLAFGWIFKKAVYPTITERAIFLVTLIFWFLLLTEFTPSKTSLVIFLGVSLFILYELFSPHTVSHAIKLLLYCWFIIATITIAVWQVSPLAFSFFFTGEATVGPGEAVTSGMVFMFAATYLWAILALIPLPRDGQTIAARIKEVGKHTRFLARRFANVQEHPIKALGLAALYIFLLGAASLTGVVHTAVVVNLLLVATWRLS